MIVVRAASKERVDASMAEFVRSGLSITIATFALSTAVLSLLAA